MALIVRSFTIQAPVEVVFEVVDDPYRVREWAAGASKVSDVVKTEARLGDTVLLTYSAVGLQLPVTMTVEEHQKPSIIVLSMRGELTGTMTFRLRPEAGGTRVDWDIDYTMKGGILGKIADHVLVQRVNEHNATRSLENLRTVCEASP